MPVRKVTPLKFCLNCGKMMHRKFLPKKGDYKETLVEWERRKYCSRSCSGAASVKKNAIRKRLERAEEK